MSVGAEPLIGEEANGMAVGAEPLIDEEANAPLWRGNLSGWWLLGVVVTCWSRKHHGA